MFTKQKTETLTLRQQFEHLQEEKTNIENELGQLYTTVAQKGMSPDIALREHVLVRELARIRLESAQLHKEAMLEAQKEEKRRNRPKLPTIKITITK